MNAKSHNDPWTELTAELREARALRPLRHDEIAAELRGGGPSGLTEEHLSRIVAYATTEHPPQFAAGRYAQADPAAARLLDEVSSCGLVSTVELRAVDEARGDSSTRRTSEDYLSDFTRRKLLSVYEPQRRAGGLKKGVLFADYLLLETIGLGGMGEVFRALHLPMNRIVALKVVSAKAAELSHNLTRFDVEVKALAKLNHPNIVTAYNAGQSDGMPYLVMEYVDGSDLAQLVHRIGPLAPSLTLRYLLQAARGLEYAHRQGIIHRDVKPSNMLVDSSGVLKVSDLGLAKVLPLGQPLAHDPDATATGIAVGTFSYMSPEQASGSGLVDARSDIYGLGCTLYFLLLGRPPALGSTSEEKMQWHLEGVVPSLRSRRPELPERLDRICRRMLAKSRQDRPESMAEVIKELVACQELLGEKVVLRAEVEPTVDWPLKPAAREDGAALPRRWRPRSLWPFAVGTILAGLSIALFAYGYSGSRREIVEPTNGILQPTSEIAELSSAPAGEVLTNDVGMSLTLIHPGEFWMGSNRGVASEQPRHRVRLTKMFYMGTHEVNRRQYQEVTNPAQPIPPLPDTFDEAAAVDPGALPQVNVTWLDAVEFCRWLSARPAEKRAGRVYRLPTEAEWEYCCRAGTDTAFSTGDDISPEQANFGAEFRPPSVSFPGAPRLLEVGSFPPNPFGLHDMHGNALEWCKDRYGDYDRVAATDPQGAKDGQQRVVRGGATTYKKDECRSASRRYKHPDETNQFTGFRVVCVMETE